MRKKVVAQIELNVARDADHDPACQEQEDAADGGDLQHLQCKVQQLRGRDSGVEIIHGVADDLGSRTQAPLLRSMQKTPAKKPQR